MQEDGTKFSSVSTLLAVQLIVSFILASAVELVTYAFSQQNQAEALPSKQKTLLSLDGAYCETDSANTAC